MTGPKFSFDKPGKYIGQPTERPDTRRLLKGRGKFVDDIQLPRMLHAAFLRSPVAHAKIKSIDTNAAEKIKGVVKILNGTDFVDVVEPYVGVLSHLGVKFNSVNVLEDPEIREGIKEYSDWPTIPQLYVKNEFVGGCDIIREMHENGELKDYFTQAGVSS